MCSEGDVIVSGDSLGNTLFWSTATGSLTEGYKSHAADVNAVVMHNDKTVFCCGADPKVTMFVRTEDV